MGKGRPAKIIPSVSDEAVKAVKEMAKSYKKAKAMCAFVPMKRMTLFSIMEVSTEDYEATGHIDYRRDAAERIHPDDKKVITTYEEKMRNIWLLEHGVAAIADERTRAIAEDTLLEGLSPKCLVKKYGISVQAVRARKREGVRWVAAFVEASNEVF